jgi:radical SAM superfamily enzyme YgiQ (UPF0313 family)
VCFRLASSFAKFRTAPLHRRHTKQFLYCFPLKSRLSSPRFVREHEIGLVGIGAMTRMVAKAYRMADAMRAVGVPVVMGGPHVTEAPDEALGRDGGPRHADAVALGEADETWPQIVADAARGKLKETYAPVDADGQFVTDLAPGFNH